MERAFCVGAALVACAVWICGCVGDEVAPDAGSDASPNDATVDVSDASGDTTTGDGATPMCDPSTSFGAAVKVTELDTGDDARFRLASTYLSGYFQRGNDAGVLQIYSTTRSSTTAPFGNVAVITGLTDGGSASQPSVTGDDLTLYFLSGPISVATRSSTLAQFKVAGTVAGLTGFGTPFIREDGNVMYLAQGGNGDISRATKASSGFNAPVALSELHVANAAQSDPVITPDDLVLYYASSRSDGGAAGGLDIWVASRKNATDPFGSVRNVAELNTTADDKPNFITRDRCTIFFHRVTGPLEEIWTATKSP